MKETPETIREILNASPKWRTLPLPERRVMFEKEEETERVTHVK